jgi:hypothetical protein
VRLEGLGKLKKSNDLIGIRYHRVWGYYLQYTKYIFVCLFVMFFLYTLFYFYTYVPHYYVSFYAIGLADCVSLFIMGVLCVVPDDGPMWPKRVALQ